MSALEEAYQAGKDCALHGPNLQNCSFRFFEFSRLGEEWERGMRDGQAEKVKAAVR